MKYINKIFYILRHFVKRVLFFLTKIIFILVCDIIFILTYEPFKWKKITKRKIKRIRCLTKFKLWLWKHFRWYIEFIGDDKYYKNLEKRYGM